MSNPVEGDLGWGDDEHQDIIIDEEFEASAVINDGEGTQAEVTLNSVIKIEGQEENEPDVKAHAVESENKQAS